MTGRASTLAISLLDDLGDRAGADGPAALADREALADLERDRGDELDGHVDVVAGHDHLGALGQPDRAGHVGRAQVELRPVAVVEGGVAAALLLGQDVDAGDEAGVGGDAAGLGADPDDLDLLADLDLAALDPAGGDGAAALDAEDVLDRHEEGPVDRPLGG